ncbi:hypothetical protein AWB83_04716 [Caballeronia ptereochthonis]|uniref:Uncharacterized protein n=1 Tax=Caballeronia ptereochthonis TaxID=1777144 RepID=A0A158CWD4_9BURK|nr:hypothetical protein AWB83_04716 [Caballeronia ptereochthonis]
MGEIYQARLARVVAYIHDHLDDELDLNRLGGLFIAISLASDLSRVLWRDGGGHRQAAALASDGECARAWVRADRFDCGAGRI